MNIYDKAINVYSQHGEDGIIIELLNTIQTVEELNKYCCEFGAWDGKHYSNTLNLVENNGYKCLMIEGDKKKYNDLYKFSLGKNIDTLNCYVGIKENTIDSIISNYNYPTNMDIMSIDIDGDDYYIFESMKVVRPKIVVIEYNPTIPAQIVFKQKPGESIGASFDAIMYLALKKDYSIVCGTKTNIILVDNKYMNQFKNYAINPYNSKRSTECITSVIEDYNGNVYIIGKSQGMYSDCYKENIKLSLNNFKENGLRNVKIYENTWALEDIYKEDLK